MTDTCTLTPAQITGALADKDMTLLARKAAAAAECGKVLTVSGKVKDVAPDGDPETTIGFFVDGDGIDVVCRFPAEFYATVSGWAGGEDVTVRGVIDHANESAVFLKDGAIV